VDYGASKAFDIGLNKQTNKRVFQVVEILNDNNITIIS
jgi:hypothetical protein